MKFIELNNVGSIFFLEGLYDLALQYFKAAWEDWTAKGMGDKREGFILAHNCAQCLYKLGRISQAMGMVEVAKRLLTDSRPTEPSNPVVSNDNTLTN